MPCLTCGPERYVLQPGDNVLGGSATGTVPIQRLALVTPTANIVVYPDGSATIQRIAPRGVVRVNKRTVGVTPRLLREGARIDVAGCRLFYEARPVAAASHSSAPSPAAADPRAVTQLIAVPTVAVPEIAAPVTPAVLVAPLAVLEIVRGPLAGRRFYIDRPVTTIGRAADCDVRFADESVSAAHATLMQKGDDWFVVDLRSSNGTFVDGHRIAGERSLNRGSRLRLGSLELSFAPTTGRTMPGQGTQHLPGFAERFSKLW